MKEMKEMRFNSNACRVLEAECVLEAEHGRMVDIKPGIADLLNVRMMQIVQPADTSFSNCNWLSTLTVGARVVKSRDHTPSFTPSFTAVSCHVPPSATSSHRWTWNS